MKIRYTLIDHKKNTKYTYATWQWELAWITIFVIAFGLGFIIAI
jgi:hypothetical protein